MLNVNNLFAIIPERVARVVVKIVCLTLPGMIIITKSNQSMEDKGAEISQKDSFLMAVFVLLSLTLAMFGDVLFTSMATVLSREGTDLSSQFIHWRAFGFNQLQQGNLALWNPHTFSGTPFLGWFQSALLYPLNFLYLILTLPKAINWGIALHIFLAGLFMYLWSSHRRLHPIASLLSSVLLMFCGAHFMHIYAGHLSSLCAMIWVPLLFLSIDGIFDKRSLGWCLLGMFAVTMQILAGHPQYVFYTAVAAVIYSGLCMIKAKERAIIALELIGIYLGAIALGAVQLLSGMQAAGESVRSGGLSYEFASMFSFPPENLLTLLAPGFFGTMASIPYWGRCYLWEMMLFISVTGFVLAIYGSLYGERSVRRFSVTMTLILLVLALGAHTPLFRVLYTCVPGFDKFRGNSKFIFQFSLFVSMLAGIGFDRLLRYRRIHWRIMVVLLVVGVLVGIAALCIRYSATTTTATGLWHRIMQAVYATQEAYLPTEAYRDANFLQKAGFFASKSLMISAGTCLLLSALFLLSKFSERVVYAIAFLAVVEIFVFARTSRPTFDLTSTQPTEIKEFLTEHHGDYRVLYLKNPNAAMSLGMQNIWGYDPAVLRRYAEFMAFTQGYNLDNATQYVRFSHLHRLYEMLRCRYFFHMDGDQLRIMPARRSMSRLELIQDWLVVTDRDQIFATMEDADFDLRQRVVLETLPDPKPLTSEKKGTARIIDSLTDHLTIEAELPHSAILLITDAYSKGWRARALPGSVQKKYNLMPANYILRAIPLSSGYHLIRVEYLPMAFLIGKWVSIVSVIIYIGVLGWYYQRMYKVGHPVKSR